MSAAGDDAGTTLIEALAVVAITAAVSLIAFPRMQQSFLALAQRQTATAVAERLRETRAWAVSRDTPVIFAAASGGRGYGPSTLPASPTPPGVAVFVDAPGRIAFFGDGSSTGGVVRVRAGARRVLAVRVAPTGGAVAADRS
jgi:type II secretory pathway pseudopilin PulG